MNRIISGFLFVGCIAFVSANYQNIAGSGKPLFLTPYIENGKINEGREKSVVKHPELKDTESYAGFLTINKTYNSNTFFWYFPSAHKPQSDPLILWLNGGPGSTSLFGLFVENGPYIITEDQTVEVRNESWHKNHNILYVDNPVGSGYSFTENELGMVNFHEQSGRDVLTALIQFYKLFPELRENDLYVSGESYGGKWVPATSYAIHTHNKKSESKINLKGLSIGNGWINPTVQINDYHNTLWDIGLIDPSEREQVKEIQEQVQALLAQGKYSEATMAFDVLLTGFYTPQPTLFKKTTGFDFFYNYLRTREPDESERFVDWVTRPDVRKALHVGYTEFYNLSMIVPQYLKEDILRSSAHFLEELLEDYKVIIYCGQLDILVSCVGTQKTIAGFKWSGAEDFSKAEKKVWYVDNEIAGHWKAAGNLHYVMVRNGGHYLPFDRPLWAWDLITRFTHDLEF